ncbi:MAG: 1,4-alpha-glucan branching protein GlgB [Dehalococcoidia bacterium]|nr:1,4-alpha-glucan branching protein GlgB [Dehalococcoidia bacterium]
MGQEMRYGHTVLTQDDIYLFNEGSHFRLYEKLGARPMEVDGQEGVHFAVWAPNAVRVSVVGDFNGWKPGSHQLRPVHSSGIWEGFCPGLSTGSLYKYHIQSSHHHYKVDKTDPFALHCETAPRTASIVWNLDYGWGDADWMAGRAGRNSLSGPMSIYEVHLGSWRRVPEDGFRSLSYREMAPLLADYIVETGFTHVEFLPVMEHPFFGSWGYQTTGYFAPSSRYGTPQDLMYLIDYLHQRGIGVILDWVPSHFPTDEHGLAYFDGTHLYEHADRRQGFHPDWSSYIFNYGRNEVRSFLISSALFWLDKYHADGLRVDAVASMLYLDYSRQSGEWIPNEYGGRENLDAISFLRRLNSEVYAAYPDVQTIAEESTAWPMVSRPTFLGGLGFGFKWDMGWMHDTLDYMEREPVHRKYHHGTLTFRMLYGFTENFILPLSHDEVVHGKGSLLSKMAGDEWQKFANLRALFGYMYGMAGKKLLFMGGEIAQWNEWNHDGSIDWHLLDYDRHARMREWVSRLNRAHREVPALHEQDCVSSGFEWISADDVDQSVVAFLRKSADGSDVVLVVCNYTPVPRHNYRVGVPCDGEWKVLLNSDDAVFGGSGMFSPATVAASSFTWHGRPYSIEFTLPPLSTVFLRPGQEVDG